MYLWIYCSTVILMLILMKMPQCLKETSQWYNALNNATIQWAKFPPPFISQCIHIFTEHKYTECLFIHWVCNIPIYEERDSTVILSFTRGEVFPYSIPRPTAEGGVWKYFTKGEGKYNCTVPIFIYRYDILFTRDIYSILSLGRNSI